MAIRFNRREFALTLSLRAGVSGSAAAAQHVMLTPDEIKWKALFSARPWDPVSHPLGLSFQVGLAARIPHQAAGRRESSSAPASSR
jgi:hypothetical protein